MYILDRFVDEDNLLAFMLCFIRFKSITVDFYNHVIYIHRDLKTFYTFCLRSIADLPNDPDT